MVEHKRTNIEKRNVTRKLKDERLGELTNDLTIGTAGAAARWAVNPLSTAKIFAEVGSSGGGTGAGRVLPGVSGVFTRGALPGAIRIVPQYAIQVGIYDILSSKLDKPSEKETITVKSTFSNCINVRSHQNPVKSLQRIAKSEGFYRGIYRGLGVSLVGSAMFSGSFFMLWELLDQVHFIRGRLEPLILPVISAGTAALISHPVDILRKTVMAEREDLMLGGKPPKIDSSGMKSISVNRLKQSNISTVYRGVVSNLMKTGPQIGVFAVALCGLQKALTWNLPS